MPVWTVRVNPLLRSYAGNTRCAPKVAGREERMVESAVEREKCFLRRIPWDGEKGTEFVKAMALFVSPFTI